MKSSRWIDLLHNISISYRVERSFWFHWLPTIGGVDKIWLGFSLLNAQGCFRDENWIETPDQRIPLAFEWRPGGTRPWSIQCELYGRETAPGLSRRSGNRDERKTEAQWTRKTKLVEGERQPRCVGRVAKRDFRPLEEEDGQREIESVAAWNFITRCRTGNDAASLVCPAALRCAGVTLNFAAVGLRKQQKLKTPLATAATETETLAANRSAGPRLDDRRAPMAAQFRVIR